MHRLAAGVAAASLAALFAGPGTAAVHDTGRKPTPTPAQRPAAAQPPSGPPSPGQPPHAWLFGTWTGGLFPAPSNLDAEACLSQPVVIFTRDVVLRAVITDQLFIQRVIETALITGKGVRFRFASAAGNLSAAQPFAAPAVAAGPAGAGFGCDNPDDLTVERQTQNQISFPACGDFPYPLVRCPSR